MALDALFAKTPLARRRGTGEDRPNYRVPGSSDAETASTLGTPNANLLPRLLALANEGRDKAGTSPDSSTSTVSTPRARPDPLHNRPEAANILILAAERVREHELELAHIELVFALHDIPLDDRRSVFTIIDCRLPRLELITAFRNLGFCMQVAADLFWAVIQDFEEYKVGRCFLIWRS
jgi:hypothetical protein